MRIKQLIVSSFVMMIIIIQANDFVPFPFRLDMYMEKGGPVAEMCEAM